MGRKLIYAPLFLRGIVFMTKTVTVFPAVTTRNSEFSVWAYSESTHIFMYVVILSSKKIIPKSRFYLESQPPDIILPLKLRKSPLPALSRCPKGEGRDARPLPVPG